MRQSIQRGHLRCVLRKFGPACWEYLWREYSTSTSDKPIRRTIVVGTTDQYKTRDSAIAAINGLVLQVNAERHRRPGYSISIGDLIDHDRLRRPGRAGQPGLFAGPLISSFAQLVRARRHSLLSVHL
jgi:hypothetical protein